MFVSENKICVYGGVDSHVGTHSNMYYLDLEFLGHTEGKLGSPT
jgi:hypothetical protein